MRDFKYVYGPVYSWRLGRSLGVDPLSREKKKCNFDCIYCQVGRTRGYTLSRRKFAEGKDLLGEVRAALGLGKTDYITLSGSGEPTLALNIGSVIKHLKKLKDSKVAVITNSTMLPDRKVRRELLEADTVLVKLDAFSQGSFKRINRPARGITYAAILKGIKQFRKEYGGRLCVQVMFTAENECHAGEISGKIRELGMDEVHLNTPLRPCGVKPLSRKKLADIRKHFRGMKVKTVYDKPAKKVRVISAEASGRRGR